MAGGRTRLAQDFSRRIRSRLAHYEGFCKFAWDLYLDALEQADVQQGACRREIAELSLSGHFSNLRKDATPPSIWDLCASFEQLLRDNIQFNEKLRTKSNLYPNVSRENSAQLCLPFDMVLANETKLRALVTRRNDIAHGQKTIVKTLDEYASYEDAALLVMHELAVGVIESLENKRYLAPVSLPQNW